MSQPSTIDAKLLDLIYAAAINPDGWALVMQVIADRAGGAGAALVWQDVLTNEAEGVYTRMDPEALQLFTGYFATRNPLRPPAELVQKALPGWVPGIVLDQDRMPKDEFVKTEFYNDFFRRFGFHSSAAIGLSLDRFKAGTLDILRSGKNGAFTAEELAFCASVQPHLVRAYELGRKLASERDIDGAVAINEGRSAGAIFVLSPEGRVLRMNGAAEALARGKSQLRIAGGRLTADTPASPHRLDVLIARAGAADWEQRTAGSMSLVVADRSLPHSVTVTPFGGAKHPIFSARGVVVCVTDIEDPIHLPIERMKQVFGLTRAEGRLAQYLFAGLSMHGAASELGITVNTARNQLARIFEKTQTDTQAGLARRMMRLAEPGV